MRNGDGCDKVVTRRGRMHVRCSDDGDDVYGSQRYAQQNRGEISNEIYVYTRIPIPRDEGEIRVNFGPES